MAGTKGHSGGARKNAGRKKSKSPKLNWQVRLTPTELEELKKKLEELRKQ